jgi:plastocyanin
MRLIVALVFAVAACGSRSEPSPRTLQVEIRGMQFVPASLRVHRGDTIVFSNHDLVPHTATASGWFDSGALSPGQSWTYVVTEAVDYDYVCSMHPMMKGQLLAHR